MAGTNVYIGLNDFAVEGQWLWDEDGSPATWTNWGPLEPNNGNDGASEQCAFMFTRHGGKWNDQPCDWLEAFWCQTPSGGTIKAKNK